MGRPDIALELMRAPSSLAPPLWVVRVNEGIALMALQEFARAAEVLAEAAEAAPYQPGVVATLAALDVYSGRPAAARARVQRALEVQPDSNLLWGARGDLDLGAQRYADAATAYGRVLAATGGSDIEAQIGLAHASLFGGDAESARELLEGSAAAAQARLTAGDESFLPRAWLARVEALRERPGASLRWLGEAADHGMLDRRWVEIAPEFAAVRKEPGFETWLQAMRTRVTRLGSPAGTQHAGARPVELVPSRALAF
jgi:tetratricopeptide (TPR) repeat protein